MSEIPKDPSVETAHLNPNGTRKRRKVDRVAQAAKYEQELIKHEGDLPLTSADPQLPKVDREVKEKVYWWEKD